MTEAPATNPSHADIGQKSRDTRPEASSSRRGTSPVKRQEVPSKLNVYLIACGSAELRYVESINATAAKRALKGASLANPNKKARKYQELEFEDD